MGYYRTKPGPGTRLDPNNPLARSVFGCWPLNEGGGTTLADLTGRNQGTLTSTTWAPTQYGQSVNSAGSPAFGSIALDLSDTAIITVAFWMKWTTFAQNDLLAMEFTANGNTVNGAFIADPNESSSSKFNVGSSKFSGSATYWQDTFTRPSAGVWHHYALVIDRTTPANTAYVDGVKQTLATLTHTASAMGNFANSTLYLLSRGGASLFGVGGLAQLAIWKRTLNASEVLQLYTDPYCLFAPQRRSLGKFGVSIAAFMRSYHQRRI